MEANLVHANRRGKSQICTGAASRENQTSKPMTSYSPVAGTLHKGRNIQKVSGATEGTGGTFLDGVSMA